MTSEESRAHERATLDRELTHLKEDVLELGEMVDRAMARAMEALMEQDMDLAEEVRAEDERVNDKRFEIEEHCLSLIATQQPTAGDLRAIVAAMNMVTDLERMGDHAVGIAEAVIRGEDEPKLEVPEDIPLIAGRAREMLKLALRSYQEGDLDLAHEVAAMDQAVDEQYRVLFRKIMENIAQTPSRSGAGIRLQFASHNLERFADRTTNLVERVIFKHRGEMQEMNPEPGETGLN